MPTLIGTGLPSSVPGVNLHSRTAPKAWFSNPLGLSRDLTTPLWLTVPSGSTTASTSTVPTIFALIPAVVYTGGTCRMSLGRTTRGSLGDGRNALLNSSTVTCATAGGVSGRRNGITICSGGREARPSVRGGYCHCLTAAIAAWSRPYTVSSDLATITLLTVPSARTITSSQTSPWTPARLALSGYVGSIFLVGARVGREGVSACMGCEGGAAPLGHPLAPRLP